MSDHPINLTYEEVRSLQAKQLTHLWKVVRHQPWGSYWERPHIQDGYCTWTANLKPPSTSLPVQCPAVPGDRLWVKETWVNNFGTFVYRADCEPDSYEFGAVGWRASTSLPRKRSRFTLEVLSLRITKLHTITGLDTLYAGIWPRHWAFTGKNWERHFKTYWNRIHRQKWFKWDANPWAWVIEVRQISK